jgi:hypothetical protein
MARSGWAVHLQNERQTTVFTDGARRDRRLPVAARSVSSQRGGTNGVMGSLGFHPVVAERPRSKPEAIVAARAAFARCQFDEQAYGLGLRRLRAYRKEWAESRGVWKDRPRHDEASHGADAFLRLQQLQATLAHPDQEGRTSAGWSDGAECGESVPAWGFLE